MEYYEMLNNAGCMTVSELMIVTIPILMKSHKWNIEDRILDVYESKRKYILGIFNIPMKIGYITEECITTAFTSDLKEKDPDKILIGTQEFFEIIYDDLNRHNCTIPDELYAILGISNGSNTTRKITDRDTDMAVCQGIARTLWDINPLMTIENIRTHKAIQIYGNGQQYRDEKTLRRWISEVDQRVTKRGRKKKAKTESDDTQ